MRKIVYYVATSIDGFISGPNEDISGFMQTGPGVDQYRKDLLDFDTVIMGRKTYEFGYQYGLTPGQPAYPHMRHYIFSSNLRFEQAHEQVEVCPIDVEIIKNLKAASGTAIYLCGGGQFATWLLEQGLIDEIKIKLNPLILGGGTSLFGPVKRFYQLKLMSQETFAEGLLFLTYRVVY